MKIAPYLELDLGFIHETYLLGGFWGGSCVRPNFTWFCNTNTSPLASASVIGLLRIKCQSHILQSFHTQKKLRKTDFIPNDIVYLQKLQILTCLHRTVLGNWWVKQTRSYNKIGRKIKNKHKETPGNYVVQLLAYVHGRRQKENIILVK